MKTDFDWKDYRLIATGGGEKLEKFGPVTVVRPDPQVIWEPYFDLRKYKDVDAIYGRSSTGGGCWDEKREVPETFFVHWRELTFELKLMGFKHVGIFPEQAVNWSRMIDAIRGAGRPISVLNLFGYTGGATVACAYAGAKVCHVDAAKAMCETAKRNVSHSGVDRSLTRFIVDDCIKFVEREIRRGNKYDAVVMDPPSYGRGPKGETWKLETGVFDLVRLTRRVLSDDPLFFLINSYTTGLQPTVMKNVSDIVFHDIRHETDADEIGILGEDGLTLPCGCSAFTVFR
ncbi:MAG: class I SAM-dependent methyltransferase [Clostridia bacterium]|nr:class I SAM-dependent methyltransferase [Clostridia bacterium]